MSVDPLELAEQLDPTPPRPGRVWERTITLLSVANATALSLHLALACGLTPWFTGFAKADDLQDIKQALVSSLEGRLFDLRVQQCEAIAQGKSPRAYTQQIEERQKRYEAQTGHRYPLPLCSEL